MRGRGVVSKRLTKQEAREDRVAVAATQAYEYARRNARWVLGGIAVAAVAIVVALLLAQGRARAERQASSAMTQAQGLYMSGDFSQAATQFQAVADHYGSARSARLARLYEANAQLASGNAADAEQSFRRFLGSSRTDPISLAAAHRGLGGSLAGQGKTAEAAAEYEKAAKIDGDPMLADDWLNAGRCYLEAGQKNDAVRAFQAVLDQSSQSAAASEAKERLAEALARQ
jgi:TolA-binding protein